ncbi:MAG: uncharacterized protein QOH68_783 [Nocardioidaceae bacterium]|jgi:uncharacterized OB-fold protein|nr:uncharacterized protein [Nocardioidaceae bacterium]
MSQIPAVDYLVLEDEPHLVANECVACGALYLDRRNACAKCSERVFERRELANEGEVVAFTIVHRAAKGLDAPYTSVVVELDRGGVVKTNLRGVTDPAKIQPRLRVRLVTFPVGKDDEDTTAVAFAYEPIGA